MLSKAAKAAMGKIGKASGRSKPWFMLENGRYYDAKGNEISGAGAGELIESGLFKPAGDSLFGCKSQSYHFDASAQQ